MKLSSQLLGSWCVGLLGASLLGVAASPANAQAVLRIDSDTSSFEKLALTNDEVGVRVSYTHYRELPESDDTNVSYRLIYQGEDHDLIETYAWVFAEFVLQDLDGDGVDEVIARNYSGGAHCCTNTTIHRWTGEAFSTVETGYLDGLGADLADLNDDGHVELAIPHQAFLYKFGSYAESFPPMMVFTYRDGELVDTTHQFPDLIRDQAKHMRSTFLRVRAEDDYVSNSLLASYVAQQAVLNEDFEAAWQFMMDNYDPEVTWGLEIYQDGEQVGTYPDFPTALEAFLVEAGYLGEDGLPIRDRMAG